MFFLNLGGAVSDVNNQFAIVIIAGHHEVKWDFGLQLILSPNNFLSTDWLINCTKHISGLCGNDSIHHSRRSP